MSLPKSLVVIVARRNPIAPRCDGVASVIQSSVETFQALGDLDHLLRQKISVPDHKNAQIGMYPSLFCVQ